MNLKNIVFVISLCSILFCSFSVVVNSDGSDRDDGNYYFIPTPYENINGLCLSVKFSGDGQYMAVGHHGQNSLENPPFLNIYKLGSLNHTWYKLQNTPAVQPGGGVYGVAFLPSVGNPQYLVCSAANFGTLFANFYKITGDTFTKLSNPALLPAGYVKDCAGTPNGSYCAFAETSEHGGTSGTIIYRRSGDTFTGFVPSGSATNVYSVKFNHNGTVLASGSAGSPYLTMFKYGTNNGTWYRKTMVDILPTNRVYAIEFSDDDMYLTCTLEFSPFLAMYQLNTADHKYYKITNPIGTPGYECRAVAFSRNSTYMALGYRGVNPYFSMYKLSTVNGSWYRIPNLETMPPNYTYSIAFSYNNSYMATGFFVASYTPPYFYMYKLNRSGSPSSPEISFISIEGNTSGVQVYTNVPYFEWNKIDTALYYNLEISNSSSFTTLYRNISLINEDNYPVEYSEVLIGSVMAVHFRLPASYKLNHLRLYYCRVRAYRWVA